MRLRIARVRARPSHFQGWLTIDYGVPSIERIARSKRTRRMKVEFLTHMPLGEILSLPKPPILLTLEAAEALTISVERLCL